MFFTLGCIKETPELVSVDSSGNSLEFRNMDPDDGCRCYLRILSVYQGSNPATSGSLWQFEDITLNDGSSAPDFRGDGQSYYTGPTTVVSLPTPFRLLDGPPSNGDRVFRFTDLDADPINEDLTINVEVHCVGYPGEIGGNPYYIKTYTESYRLDQGTPLGGDQAIRLFHPLNANTTFGCWRTEGGS